MAYKLLIIDGDRAARTARVQQLSLFGARAIAEAASGMEALAILDQAAFRAIIVESQLPDMSGSDFCWVARRKGVLSPILLLGDERESTLVLALESGADDYLGRPFGPSAFLARLRVQLRRRSSEREDLATSLSCSFPTRAVLRNPPHIARAPRDHWLIGGSHAG